MSDTVGTEARRALLEAVRAVLRPLVRRLIAAGVTYPAFSHLAKEVYLEVGRRHFTLDFKQQTDSRVALVTGIPRKEIGRLRRGQAPPRPRRGAHGPLPARVVARWRGGPPYTDAAGRPYALPYDATDRASFTALVGECGGDIPPRAVLDELLRLGTVRLTARDSILLVEAGEAAAADVAQPLAALGHEAAALLESGFARLEEERRR